MDDNSWDRVSVTKKRGITYEPAARPKSEGSGWFGLKKLTSVKFKVPGISVAGPAIPIRGINGDLPVRFAPDGGAVPGDRIVGIVSPGEGITIYPIQSQALSAFEDKPESWLDVRWGGLQEPNDSGAACTRFGEAHG